MIDRTMITDPPDYPTRYRHDDTPETLGDDFTLSAEDDAKITRAARPNLVRRALAGDREALADMEKLQMTWEVRR